MRKGQNPAKYVNQVAKPEKITVAVLSHIPFLSGFHAETLEVLKVCLDSIRESTDLPHDLLVFDNGSCEEARGYLIKAQEAGKIQLLILSDQNLGKGGAWNIIFQAAPGEIIAYSDSDIFFYPGWLSSSLQVLETYPNVGMVTSRPIRTPPQFHSRTLEWARQTAEVQVEEGQLLTWEVFRDFVLSMGVPEGTAREWYEPGGDVRLTYKGVRAYAGAGHFQFVARKSVLAQFLPFDMTKPMGQVRELDRLMNEAGYLRLMTEAPLVQNMSNTLDNAPVEAGRTQRRKTAGGAGSAVQKLANLPLVKRALLAVHDAIFRLYFR
jgi:glycosyltransferase involved in cell wall biosynthesis